MMQRTIQLLLQSYYACCHDIDSPACIRSCHAMISVEGGRAREERRAMYVCATPRTYLARVCATLETPHPSAVRSLPSSFLRLAVALHVRRQGSQHIVASFATAQRELRSRRNELRQRMYTKSVVELSLTIESVSIRTKCPAKHDPTASESMRLRVLGAINIQHRQC